MCRKTATPRAIRVFGSPEDSISDEGEGTVSSPGNVSLVWSASHPWDAGITADGGIKEFLFANARARIKKLYTCSRGERDNLCRGHDIGCRKKSRAWCSVALNSNSNLVAHLQHRNARC